MMNPQHIVFLADKFSFVDSFIISRTNLREEINQFTYWADKFELLPFYFMNFYGSQSLASVVKVGSLESR